MRNLVFVLIVGLLGCGSGAARADEPAATELLDRARQGRSILDVDSTGHAMRAVTGSLGLGVTRIGAISEWTVYPMAGSRTGVYIGAGFGSWYGEFVGVETFCAHFGMATRIDDTWQLGIGLEYDGARASLYWAPTLSTASTAFVGPQGWIEAGSRRGFAVRFMVSQVAPGISLHWRS